MDGSDHETEESAGAAEDATTEPETAAEPEATADDATAELAGTEAAEETTEEAAGDDAAFWRAKLCLSWTCAATTGSATAPRMVSFMASRRRGR